MSTEARIIAFCGPKGSGKDTAAAYLLARNTADVLPGISYRKYFKKIAFAAPIKEIAQRVFGLTPMQCEDLKLKETLSEQFPFEYPRAILQDVANWFRARFGPDVWVHAWRTSAMHAVETHYGAVIVTDLRFPNELAMLQEMGAVIVYVQNDQAEKELAEAQASGDVLATNVSEQHYAELRAGADYILDNNGTLHELHKRVHSLTISVFGNWQHWSGVAQVNNFQSLS